MNLPLLHKVLVMHPTTKMKPLLCRQRLFDGCLVRDGVHGGGDGAIYRRWQDNTSASDNYIHDSISLQRWHQLKRILKLNNNDRAIKRGEEGYNPCYKYDMIYDVIIKNTIAITKKGGA